MKNNKHILVFLGVALAIISAFPISKYLLPNAVSESMSESKSQTYSQSATTAVTELVSQIITEITTLKEHTTEILTTHKVSTDVQTEENTLTNIHTTNKSNGLKLPSVPDIQIQIPTLKLPDLIPLTTASATNGNNIDLSCFDNSVFLGNSRLISFKNYGLAKNVYSVVGLNVDTVFTKSVSGSNVTVINELNEKKYDKVILMFGDNECGWPNQNIFIEKYAEVIAAVRERVPRAKIYLHSILPVSAEASAKSDFGCNNQTINSLNLKIKQLAADEGVYFIEQPTCLKDSDGALLSQAASDGIHLNKKYSKIWLEYLANTII